MLPGAEGDMYIDQSAAELRLNVVDGPLDLSQFTLLAADRIFGTRLSVRAGIIGASHVLEVRHPGLPALHEVFACCDVRPPPAPGRQLYSGGVLDLAGAFECEPADGFGYRFRSEVADLAAAASVLARLEERVGDCAGSPGQIGLHYTFPCSPRSPDSPAPPKTVVWAALDPDERSVRVETAHCYPNEGSVVFSESRIRLAGRDDVPDAAGGGGR
jgi:hypothetical protein